MVPSDSHNWNVIPGGITAPSGFKASGIKAGLKVSGKPDLALLLAPKGALCAATFTTSEIRAACIDLCAQRLQLTRGQVRAVLINSGQANACTGEQGLIDSLAVTSAVAQRLGVTDEEVLICSTGVIGELIPIKKLLSSLDQLVAGLTHQGSSAAAQAILTTDLRDKQIALEANLGGRRVRIGGMAKGSGMIHPDMATMLGYLTCDVSVPFDLWKGMISKVVESTFNSITVDGDTSTNDAFLAFAAGEALENQYLDQLQIGLFKVAEYLAKAIVRDGEGAGCLIEVKVEGAESASDARLIARTICSSSLVKTAIHGADPNWGRIIAALGRSGVRFAPESVSLWIGSYQLVRNGTPCKFDHKKVSDYIKKTFQGNYLKEDCVSIRLEIGTQGFEGYAWGCDLSERYIRINSDYTT